MSRSPTSSSRCVSRASLFALALAASSLSACVEKPTVALHHAEITGIRVAFPPSASILMTVVINVHNPNSYDVAVRAVRGQVMMANRYALPVDFRADGGGVWLPAGKKSLVRVPVSVPVELAMALVQQAYTSPIIPYRFSGKADVTATSTFQLEKDDYSVDEQGVLSRAQVDQAIRSILGG